MLQKCFAQRNYFIRCAIDTGTTNVINNSKVTPCNDKVIRIMVHCLVYII